MNELKGKEIIVFGASENGKLACEYLSGENKILFICDNNESKWGQTIGGYSIFSPEKIVHYKDAVVVVAIVKRYTEVIFRLREMGIRDVWHFVEYCDLKLEQNKIRLRLIPIEAQIPVKVSFDEHQITYSHDNCCKSQNVLIFANHFPPIGGSGVQRPMKFAKYIKNFGYTPIVVTRAYCEKALSFDYSQTDELKTVGIIRVQDTPYYPEEMTNEDFKLLMNLLSSIGLDHSWCEEYRNIAFQKWETIPDVDVMWVIYCMNNISRFIDLKTVSIVYTTIGPYSSALFGAYLKKRYGIKWVLDYRDPWCLNDYNMRAFYEFRMDRRDFEKELEIALLKTADHVVSASEAFCDDFRKYCPVVKTTCITNGYDEEDFLGIAYDGGKGEFFDILFNGYIYDNYDIGFVLEVLNEMISEDSIGRDKLRLVFNGSDPSKYSKFMALDKNNIVRYNGYLSHRKSLESLCSANILLLFGMFGEGAYSIYSGKLFEYMRTGIPILSISSPYGVQHEMVEEHGHGITATSEDKEKIKEFILEQYTEWKDNKTVRIKEPDDYVRSFSRECLTKRLADVFDEVLSV